MLYLAATPIGNLGDITLRAVETLKACDAVYCEDTRRTVQLLNHLGIHKPLVSCHAHNEKQRAQEIAALLEDGQEIVYVSDAGMPGVSDPGAALVEECVRRDLPFTVLPGASAALMAAVMSGLPPSPFTFYGFLPRENKPRKAMLREISACAHLVLIYESPQRVQRTLTDLMDALGDCRGAVLRELTKKFEEVKRGQLSELTVQFDTPPKGECVIAVLPEPTASDTPAADDVLDDLLRALLANGVSVRDASAEAADRLHVSKKEAYRRALALVPPQ